VLLLTRNDVCARQPLALADADNKVHIATQSGFIALLTDPGTDDFGGPLRTAFLTLYRAVTTSRVLLLLLRARYEAPLLR
jgi:hypothetical protein